METGKEEEREREGGGGGGREGYRERKHKDTLRQFVCLLVGCSTSQQHASVSQGWICTDNITCCHAEIEVADQTFYLTQSQYTDTGPTSPSADPITPGAWQGSHWSANFEVTGMTRPRKKSRRKRDSNPGPSALEADALTTRPTRRLLLRQRQSDRQRKKWWARKKKTKNKKPPENGGRGWRGGKGHRGGRWGRRGGDKLRHTETEGDGGGRVGRVEERPGETGKDLVRMGQSSETSRPVITRDGVRSFPLPLWQQTSLPGSTQGQEDILATRRPPTGCKCRWRRRVV